MMDIVYTPNDVALFLLKVNMRLSEETTILQRIWEQENTALPDEYKQNLMLLAKHVRDEIGYYYFVKDEKELDELDLIMHDVDPNYQLLSVYYEADAILRYFKVIRLELIYTEKDFVKIKLRRLLKAFQYKRRSEKLVSHINEVLESLSLDTFLRGKVPCRISDINIDDMISVRLTE